MKIEQEDTAECTFMPEISNKSRQLVNEVEYTPIHRRYQEEAEDRRARLEKIRKERHEAQLEEEKQIMGMPLKKGSGSKADNIHRSKYGGDTEDGIFSAQRDLPYHQRRKRQTGVYENNQAWLQKRNERLTAERMKSMPPCVE